MRQAVDAATSLSREMMLLVLGFAMVTLAMSTLGLSGVMACAVSRRTREFGLRMALGARAGDVSRAVIRRAARLLLAGSAMGLAMAFAGVACWNRLRCAPPRSGSDVGRPGAAGGDRPAGLPDTGAAGCVHRADDGAAPVAARNRLPHPRHGGFHELEICVYRHQPSRRFVIGIPTPGMTSATKSARYAISCTSNRGLGGA